MSYSDFKRQITGEIDKGKKEQIKFLQELVQTDSSNPFIKDPSKSSPYDAVELAVAKKIYSKLNEFNLSPKLVGISEQRPNVVCEIGKGKKTLIFNGHIDTVLPNNQSKYNPFAGVIKNGKLYGVGALDMKASLAAFVYLAKAFSKYEDKLNGKICLQFVVDEEPVAASRFGTRYLLEKGYTGHAAIVGEPGMHKVNIGNKGGYRFKLEIFGEAVHTGSREWEKKTEGQNAIEQMAEVVLALQNIAFSVKSHPVFPKRKNVFTFPVMINGGKGINIVPDYCAAFGDVRLLPGVTKNYIEKTIEEKLKKLGINYKLTPIVYVPPVFVEEEETIVQILKKNAEEILHKKLIVEGSGPWSDMWMFIEKGIPAVNFGCHGAGMHGKDEYVDIESMIQTTKIYALTAIEFLK